VDQRRLHPVRPHARATCARLSRRRRAALSRSLGEDFLAFLARTHGLRGGEAKDAIARAAEDAAITDVLSRPIETLSKGYRRRVALAGAIVHDPPVLILDEPTDGLDPNQKIAMRSLIKRMGEAEGYPDLDAPAR
jgi:ABC-type multidrug transport system ATPase subunit